MNNKKEILKEFGSKEITQTHLDRLEKIAIDKGMTLHPFLKNGLFFSHRDLDPILDYYEQKKPFYLYTGRGPSSNSLHIGHLVPFMMTKYLQDLFQVPTIIQITDDEKYYQSQDHSIKDYKNLKYFQDCALENIKDIISVGFNPDLTFILQNTKGIQLLYPTFIKINKVINLNQVLKVFGFDKDDNMGKVSFPTLQIAPSFSQTFESLFDLSSEIKIKDIRCLIPCAIDQDPYFRLTRDISSKLGSHKPSLIHSGFLSSLFGMNEKMSSSALNPNSVIFLSDSPKTVKKKINKYCFSGGQETIEEHRLKGANVEVDISCHYMKYLMEDNQKYLDLVRKYQSGELLTGEIKKECIEMINQILEKIQKKRKELDDNPHKILEFTQKKILKFTF